MAALHNTRIQIRICTSFDHCVQVLTAIATLPEHQGKGFGSALLEHGLKQVDAVGARAFLEATPQGHPIYERFGWRDVDEIVFELDKYGGEGVQITTCMQRPAHGHM